MKNKAFAAAVAPLTGLLGNRLPERTRRRALVKTGCVQFGAFLLGMLMHNAVVAKELAPFGLGLAAGVDASCAIATAVGYIVGGLLLSAPQKAIYLSSVGIVAVVRLILGNKRTRWTQKQTLSPPLIAALLSFGVSKLSVYIISQTATFRNISFTLCELVLIVASGYFFSVGSEAVLKRSEWKTMSASRRLCCCLGIFIVTTAVYPVSIGLVSIGRIIILFCALLSAYSASVPLCAAVCVFGGAGLIFCEPQVYFAAVGAAAGALMLNYFYKNNKPTACVSFLAAAAAAAALASGAVYALIYLCELCVACAAFLALPVQPRAREPELVLPPPALSASKLCAGRINSVALALCEVGDIIKIASKTSKARVDTADAAINRTAENVCRGCRMMSTCWVKRYDETARAFRDMAAALAAGQRVERASLPPQLRPVCINAQQLCCEFSRNWAELRSAQRYSRNLAIYRAVIGRQFRGIANMLGTTGRHLYDITPLDEERSRRLYAAVLRLGLEPAMVQCAASGEHHLLVTAVFAGELSALQRLDLHTTLQNECHTALAEPVVTVAGGCVCFEYFERPSFRLETAVYQSKQANECGDTCANFNDAYGNAHVILADGMGTGREAVADSTVCCAFIRRLSESLFPVEDCAELANAVLALREGNESALTIDTFTINLYTGAALLFKAGAAPTFVRKDDRVAAVSTPTLPVGIMDEVYGKKYSVTLACGDAAVMISDGAAVAGDDILRILRQGDDDSAAELLRRVRLAVLTRRDVSSDDVTIIACRLERYADGGTR